VSSEGAPIPDPGALTFSHQNADLILTQHTYKECLQLADIAIAMTGTATEQFVGLGKPVLIIPAKAKMAPAGWGNQDLPVVLQRV